MFLAISPIFEVHKSIFFVYHELVGISHFFAIQTICRLAFNRACWTFCSFL